MLRRSEANAAKNGEEVVAARQKMPAKEEEGGRKSMDGKVRIK